MFQSDLYGSIEDNMMPDISDIHEIKMDDSHGFPCQNLDNSFQHDIQHDIISEQSRMNGIIDVTEDKRFNSLVGVQSNISVYGLARLSEMPTVYCLNSLIHPTNFIYVVKQPEKFTTECLLGNFIPDMLGVKNSKVTGIAFDSISILVKLTHTVKNVPNESVVSKFLISNYGESIVMFIFVSGDIRLAVFKNDSFTEIMGIVSSCLTLRFVDGTVFDVLEGSTKKIYTSAKKIIDLSSSSRYVIDEMSSNWEKYLNA